MNIFKRLFHHDKTLQEVTMVPDGIIKHYKEPSKTLQEIIQLVPSTGEVLYQHIWRCYIPKDWKYWAMDLIENGFESDGVVQLAGIDLDEDNRTLNILISTVLMELEIPADQEVFNSAFIMTVSRDVLLGYRTARSGFELLSRIAVNTDYCQTFIDFYYWLENAEEVIYYTIKGSGLRYDNIEEWMYQYFEKLAKANPKYSPLI